MKRFLTNGLHFRATATIPSVVPMMTASHGISCCQLGGWNQKRINETVVDFLTTSTCSTNGPMSSERM
ncbi:hypothetical protein B0O80DRAFT_461821, partial [Mortierella sp. GBAus27b]